MQTIFLETHFPKQRSVALTVAVSLVLTFVFLLGNSTEASGATVSSSGGRCTQTVGSDTGVSVAVVDGKCVVTFANIGTNSWTVPAGVSLVRTLVVGGGGGSGGGGCDWMYSRPGGGGAVVDTADSAVTAGTTVDIVVGAGGVAAVDRVGCVQGSLPFTVTTVGGQGGPSRFGTAPEVSGGYSSPPGTSAGGASGSGYVGSGGNQLAASMDSYSSGGGGGAGGPGGQEAGGAGTFARFDKPGKGGIGIFSDITGSSIGHGGGGAGYAAIAGAGGIGTATSGGASGTSAVNSGGSYGGGGSYNASGSGGGSGVVIISYQLTTTPFSETDTALTFADNKYAWAPDSDELDVTSAITMQAWVYQTSVVAGYWNIVLNKESSYELATNGGFWAFGFAPTSGTWTGVTTTISTRLNEWQHVALTRAAGANVTKFYLNGQEVWSGTADGASTGNLNNSAKPFTIGGRSNDGVIFRSPFQGSIDEVRVFRSARTQSEIAADMNTYGPTNTSDLALYYDFNEGSGTTLYNRVSGSSSASDLTVVGSPVWNSDVISTQTSGSPYTTRTFKRSYLTAAGGWKVPSGVSKVTALIVAGGGAGGARMTDAAGGGGGGGGLVEVNVRGVSGGSVVAMNIGAGGQGVLVTSVSTVGTGNNGQNSSIAWGVGTSESITAIGGGGGAGGVGSAIYYSGNSGGSGGGASGSSGGTYTGGSAIVPIGSGYTSYGFNGGNNFDSSLRHAGGGGGAGAVGATATSAKSGNGGAGRLSAITGLYYAGGGGGGDSPDHSGDDSGSGGIGGGGNGGTATNYAGSANTGGGGGGSGSNSSHRGASGGSGVVIVRWITATAPTFTAPATVDTITAGLQHTFQMLGSATSPLIRNYIWQSSSDTGTSWSNIQTSASDSLTTSTLETTTSGSRYLYRVVVTDSDTAGLSITDTSTAFYLVINPRITITGSSFSLTQSYGESQTVTFTFAYGTDTRTAAVTPNNRTGITWGSISGDSATITLAPTLNAGTYYETITVTDSKTAQTIQMLTLTVTQADSITVTTTGATTTYSPNTPVPGSYSITGLQNQETGTVTLNYGGVGATSYGTSTVCESGGTCSVGDLAPGGGGSYSLTPSTFVLANSASLDNYQGVIYESSTITINKAQQAPITIGQYRAFANMSSYPINVYGGSGTGVLTRTLADPGTAVCTLETSVLIKATSAGTCSVTVVKNADINYFVASTTTTIYWLTWSDAYAVLVPSTPINIPLQGDIEIVIHTETVTASSFLDTSNVTLTSARVGDHIRIVITGYEGLTVDDLTVYFRPYEDAVIEAITSTYIQVIVPTDAVTGVIAVDGPRGVAYTPSLPITP